MQVSDKNKVAMPANWPKGELFGDRVIIRLPKTWTAPGREWKGPNLSDYECLDWWLCHKKLS